MTGLERGAAASALAIERAEAGGLNAVLAFDRDVLLAEARRLALSPHGPLSGVTVAVKDNICTTDYPTTCASRMLAGYRSPFEATAVRRLRDAGALVACKTNLDEFAMGSSTEHSAYGRTRHPDDPERVPGGSSGGSAALVAVGAVDAALGSETGGSVRQPAAFCGVVGLKPTYGRVSRFGLVAYGSSLDQIGILARTAGLAGRVLAIISGRDPADATCADRDPFTPDPPSADLAGVTVGVPIEYLPNDLDPGVRAAFGRARATLTALGARVVDVSLPYTALAIPAYYVIAPAEASSNLARYDGMRYGQRRISPDGGVQAMFRATRGAGLGPEVRRRILVGTYVLSAGYYDQYYRRATAARRLIAQDFARAFETADLLCTPTTPTPAFRAGEKLADPVAMYLADRFVCPTNLAGLPAVSIPVGRAAGLPVGAQLIAPHFAEGPLLRAAAAIERAVERDREGA